MSRFVILRHDPAPGGERPLHWDLMLEQDETLLTWALSEQPSAGALITAELLPDHRKTYLDYEGPLSRDRGSVSRWDQGECFWVQQTHEVIVVRLAGRRLRGTARLKRSHETDHCWTVSFSSDRDVC